MIKNNKQVKEEIESIVKELTLDEKLGMVHGGGLFQTSGVKQLNIPPLKMSDGPMGVRAEFENAQWISLNQSDDYVSYLPCNSALASTWNIDLAKSTGEVLGQEARGRGKDVILAPGINIKRSPLCGRNFEYMSEDPKLIEEITVPFIKGVQKADVAACVKHFAANSQETARLEVDTIVDERTLQEIYYPGFKAAAQKAGSYSFMGAYNLLNGQHCCHSKKLLDDVLRDEWHYDGTVISDWGGVNDTIEAAETSLDVEMHVIDDFASHKLADAFKKKIQSGELSEDLLDQKVRRILLMMYRLKMIGPKTKERKAGSYNTIKHQKATLETARESIILLKNEKNRLPLNAKKVKSIAVIGQNAITQHSNGGGSAEIKALYEITPLMGLKKMFGGNCKISYALGYDIPLKEEQKDVNWQATSTQTGEEAVGVKPKIRMDLEKKQQLKEEAIALAKTCDEVIFVGGLNHDFDVEGLDRKDMNLPYGQDELIEALLEVRPDMVIVMYAGSPVKMPWKTKAKAILWSYYAGMEGGNAIAEVLFGRMNPSGKLAETFIEDINDCPAHSIGEFGKEDCVKYTEGIQVGYRYYNTKNTKVAFAFGHGLSYSDFTYENLKIHHELKQKDKQAKMTITVEVEITNSSEIEGKEIVQLYIAPKTKGVFRPYHELKGFQKISLKPKEHKKISFKLTEHEFSYYNTTKKRFDFEHGIYEIQVGSSSRDLKLCKNVEI